MLQRNIKFDDLPIHEAYHAKMIMMAELHVLPLDHPVRELFRLAWNAYKNNEFSYDGATFVRERNKKSIFEVAAFIHDFRNSFGYVGAPIDKEMFAIMICLQYPQELIFERYWWTRLTSANVFVHLIRGNYQRKMPKNLFNPVTIN